MTDKDWDSIMEVHLKGAFSCARACWPIMRNQKFGRILNTSSGSGIYGNFGQTNYSAAKIGLHGFTQTLAKEGEKYNIRTNSIAPAAYSRMTATIWPEEFEKYFSAEKIVPVALYLVTEQCKDNGSLIETVGGGICRHRIQRAEGAFFRGEFGPEDVAGSWGAVTNFDGTCDYPNSNTGIFERVMGLLEPKL
jgi:NAD(P)-dependent dehydrogenase (short-subunit alcohol dehydrogenase family)